MGSNYSRQEYPFYFEYVISIQMIIHEWWLYVVSNTNLKALASELVPENWPGSNTAICLYHGCCNGYGLIQ